MPKFREGETVIVGISPTETIIRRHLAVGVVVELLPKKLYYLSGDDGREGTALESEMTRCRPLLSTERMTLEDYVLIGNRWEAVRGWVNKMTDRNRVMRPIKEAR